MTGVSKADVPAALSKPAKPFEFVREHGQRAEEINEFYNRFMKLCRPMEAYRWEFHQGPAGPALIWVIVEAATAKVVGHHSIVRTPMVCRGKSIHGGRTENTIIEPAVRTKVFYPGMEKRALGEALQELSVVYTIHSRGPGPLRLRFGYKPVGRWAIYLPRVGGDYLAGLLRRVRDRLPVKLPDAFLRWIARSVASVRALAVRPRVVSGVQIAEVNDIAEIETEYRLFWERARAGYDMTIDRSFEFVRWRIAENPHLSFRTWVVRRDAGIVAVIVGHRHAIGGAEALYVDDIIVDTYGDAAFDVALRVIETLAPEAESIVLTTVAADTPLNRVLRRRLPWQARALDRFGAKMFDELLALDSDSDAPRPWYVTGIFAEGMDTSREAAA